METQEYDSWFDKVFAKMTRGIADHNFRHFNRSMGIMIYNKEHYKAEMKARRMVPCTTMEEMAEEWDNKHSHQSYDKLSPKAMDVIRSLKMSADKDGNIKLGSIAIEALTNLGVIQSKRQFTPTGLEGGFA